MIIFLACTKINRTFALVLKYDFMSTITHDYNNKWNPVGFVSVSITDIKEEKPLGLASLNLHIQVIEGQTYYSIKLDDGLLHLLSGKSSSNDRNHIDFYVCHNDKKYSFGLYIRSKSVEHID